MKTFLVMLGDGSQAIFVLTFVCHKRLEHLLLRSFVFLKWQGSWISCLGEQPMFVFRTTAIKNNRMKQRYFYVEMLSVFNYFWKKNILFLYGEAAWTPQNTSLGNVWPDKWNKEDAYRCQLEICSHLVWLSLFSLKMCLAVQIVHLWTETLFYPFNVAYFN